jgi:hypothetical protein
MNEALGLYKLKSRSPRSQLQWNISVLNAIHDQPSNQKNQESSAAECESMPQVNEGNYDSADEDMEDRGKPPHLTKQGSSSSIGYDADSASGKMSRKEINAIQQTIAGMTEDQKVLTEEDCIKNVSKIISNSKSLEMAIRCGSVKALWAVADPSIATASVSNSNKQRALTALKSIYRNYVRICPKIHASTPLPDTHVLIRTCLSDEILSNIINACDENSADADNEAKSGDGENDSRKSSEAKCADEDILLCLALRLLEMMATRSRLSNNHSSMMQFLVSGVILKAYGRKEPASIAQNLLNKFSANEMKNIIDRIDTNLLPEAAIPKVKVLLKDEILQKRRDRERQKSEAEMLRSTENERNSESLRLKLQEWQSKIDAERSEERKRYLVLKKKAEEEEAKAAKDLEESEKAMRAAREAEIKKKAKMFAKMQKEIEEQKKLQAIEQALKAEEESLRRQKMVEEHVQKWLKDKAVESKAKEVEEQKDAIQIAMPTKQLNESKKREQIEKSLKLDVKRRSVLAKKSVIRAQEKRNKSFVRKDDSDFPRINTFE